MSCEIPLSHSIVDKQRMKIEISEMSKNNTFFVSTWWSCRNIEFDWKGIFRGSWFINSRNMETQETRNLNKLSVTHRLRTLVNRHREVVKLLPIMTLWDVNCRAVTMESLIIERFSHFSFQPFHYSTYSLFTFAIHNGNIFLSSAQSADFAHIFSLVYTYYD